MSQALFIGLIASVAIGVRVSMTSPNPAAPKNRRITNDFPGIAYLALHITKSACLAHAALEIATITVSGLVKNFPSTALAQWLSINTPPILLSNAAGTAVYLSPIRAIGGILVVVGSTIRFLCYRELGRHFTYQVSLLQNHTLVTTGPYSIVRHPSYIGGDFVQVGVIIWHASSGAWMRESKIYTKMASWLVILPVLYSVGSVLEIYCSRPAVEDKLLKKQFGKKWEEWAKRVPYRLVPGIY